MKDRWLGTQREPGQTSPRPSEPQGHPVVRKEEAFWRSWLATGARRVPIDRRRARGDEAPLKKILVGAPSGAVDFSSAMARQAIDEALHELPPQHKQVVKLAYFGGLTNREIAQELGLNVSEVRRALRASLASIGAHFERGRAKGRRAIQDLAILPLWRGLNDSADRPWPSLDHVLQTGIVAAMTAAAAALIVTHPAPSHVGHAQRAQHVAAIGSAGSGSLHTHHATLVEAANRQAGTPPGADAPIRSGTLQSLPVQVTVPTLPVQVTVPTPPKLTDLLQSVASKPRVPRTPQLPFGA